MNKITPFLWFDDQAEEATNFYVSVFKQRGIDASVQKITKYPKSTEEVSGKPAGSVMTVDFRIDRQNFTAINGGPDFHFTEAVSFVISCKNQEELDYFWDKLAEGGDEKAQICGWLKDKYGLSWQVVPENLNELMSDPETTEKVMAEVLKMKKLDIATLEKAAK